MMHTDWDKRFDFYCPIVIGKFSSSTSQEEGEEKEGRDDAHTQSGTNTMTFCQIPIWKFSFSTGQKKEKEG